MATIRRIGKYALGLLVVLVVVFFLLFDGGGIGCGHRTVLVTGRLVDANTGEPLSGIYVMSLAVRAWADDAEIIERYRAWNRESAAHRKQAVKNGEWLFAGSLNASTTTRHDGTFDLILEVPCSVSYRGCLHIERRSGFEERNGAEVLRVEVPGRPPVNVEIPHGIWKDAQDEASVAARWYWGDVRVP